MYSISDVIAVTAWPLTLGAKIGAGIGVTTGAGTMGVARFAPLINIACICCAVTPSGRSSAKSHPLETTHVLASINTSGKSAIAPPVIAATEAAAWVPGCSAHGNVWPSFLIWSMSGQTTTRLPTMGDQSVFLTAVDPPDHVVAIHPGGRYLRAAIATFSPSTTNTIASGPAAITSGRLYNGRDHVGALNTQSSRTLSRCA